jgi:hypothetical protein
MKKIILLSLSLFIAASSIAQNADEIGIIQSAYGMDKRALITEQMKLSPSEAQAFWPIYEKYEVSRKELSKVRIQNIVEYSKNYKAMSNEDATKLVTSALSNNSAQIKLQQKTFKELSKVITPARAAQFTQIEMYLENHIKAKLGDEMPFIEKTK